MIPGLRGVVEGGAAGLPDDLLQRQLFVLRPGDQVVQLVDVGAVMLAVVIGERLRGDVGLEGIGRVGQIRESMLYGLLLCLGPPSIGLSPG